MRVSLTRSMLDNKPVTRKVTWAELIELLKAPVVSPCTRETCTSLLPSTVNAEGRTTKPDKCQHRKIGMWGPTAFDGIPDEKGGWKSLKHVVGMDLLVFDVDHVPMTILREIDARVTAEGLACILYSTHSDAPEADSRSVRLVFQLSESIDLAGNGDRVRAFRAAVAARLSIPVDPSTKDESRLYFLPSVPQGTSYLFGVTDGAPVVVELLEQAPSRGGAGSRDVEVRGETGSAPASAPVFDGSGLGSYWLSKADVGLRAMVRRVLKGEKITEEGGRDNALQALTGSLVFASEWGTPLDAMVELFRQSCNMWEYSADNKGLSWLAVVEDKLLRAIERRRPQEEERELLRRQKADLHEMMRGANVALPDPLPGETQEQLEARAKSKYSPEELQSFFVKAGVKNEVAFSPRWVIRNHGANWIWVNGRYQSAIADCDMHFTMQRDLQRAPFDITANHPKTGAVMPLRWQDILYGHSTVASAIQGSLSDRESWYDPKEQTFHEAVCPMRRLDAEFDEDINTWLGLFGYDQVYDWVAAVSQLKHQCAAIYLKGPKGIGKTLFADGLSRLWRIGGPSKFGDSVSVDFNSSLAECPLIFADETLPKTPTIIDELRALIGNSTHSLNRKFMPTVRVQGCVRLIIAGNNEHLLSTSAKLESDDVDAMAERVLFVDMSSNKKPVEFINHLKETHGKPYVDAWILSDKMAKHALWLAENRVLNYNNRFLVTGEPEFADRLNTQSGIVPIVMEFLAVYLSQELRAQQPSNQIRVGGGRLLVRTELLSDKAQFERYVPSHRVLPAVAVSQALRQVSTGTVELDGREYHDLRIDTFYWWVRRQQVGDLKTVRARIEGAV